MINFVAKSKKSSVYEYIFKDCIGDIFSSALSDIRHCYSSRYDDIVLSPVESEMFDYSDDVSDDLCGSRHSNICTLQVGLCVRHRTQQPH